mmetsp:Transcript_33503/g.48590  ORF Transcript_33503/g.48590 Transcript_33503/m.48590 type:complete len:232 (-) Transcript_33503:60-755(-)
MTTSLCKASRVYETVPDDSQIQGHIKLVHFVRHAQGEHNVAGEADPARGYLREDLVDASLTDLGLKQCNTLRSTPQTIKSVARSKLVLVSPMNRTLQTAQACFNGLVNCPWIALETLREQTGMHPCDRRSSKSELQSKYPTINFENIVHENDPLYFNFTNCREPTDQVTARGLEFLKWLKTIPEDEFIVVSHHRYLYCLFTEAIQIHPVVDESPHFSNCEMRSYLLDLSNL